MGKSNEAFGELEGCLDRGEMGWSHIDGDPESGVEADEDWDKLRGHCRYLALKAKYCSDNKADGFNAQA